MSEIVTQAKNPLLIFSDKLRIRRAEAEEAEVSFDDTDILAVAMDALMESGWQSPNALSTALENARKDAEAVIENYRPFPNQQTSPMRHFYETRAKPELLAQLRSRASEIENPTP